jgi:3-methyl-2-oxobutanoate hydroxymethyltransferase
MSTAKSDPNRITTHVLQEMKLRGEPISMLTSYDYSMARLVDEAGIDVILVGDSASNVMAGHETTLPITLDHMIYHAQGVVRAAKRSLIVVDMPFGSYEQSPAQAFANAARLMVETGASAVKLEGGARMAETIAFLTQRGVPVMAHIGLTPQAVNTLGGYKVVGRDAGAQQVLQDAQAVEAAGAFAVVLEKVPAALAGRVTQALAIPTIGIGAGVDCDGQVLVVDDMLGTFTEFRPRFVQRYAELGQTADAAIAAYAADVRARRFPAPEHGYAETVTGPAA